MIGKTVSHYNILEKLGQGGMGVVYKAQDLKLDRFVALKFLPQHLHADEDEKKRFIHEAKAASALDHTNICTLFEIDETSDGQMFIAMGYYEGETLKDKIAKGPLKLDEAMDIAMQVAEGLDKAHTEDIVHRDIKPANIIITSDGVVKILDFGLAKLKGQTKITKTGTTVGTVAYMSPEQTRGEEADHRSDIWSLGVVLYEMITGQSAFKGEYDQAVMYGIVNENPEPVTGLRTGVPMELDRIINKALEKDPAERFHSLVDLLVDLRKVKKGLEHGEITTRKLPTKGPSRKGLPIAAIVAGLLIVAAITVAGYFIFRGEPEEASPSGDTTAEQAESSMWQNSIAVLPFADSSPQQDQGHLAEGMVDAINDRLDKIPELKVIATRAVLRFKDSDRDIRDIGRELAVKTVLEGRLIKKSNLIRLFIQLIDVNDGSLIWSNSFTKKFESIFALQDEIAEALAEKLKVELTPEMLKSSSAALPHNLDAYEYYLRGMQIAWREYVSSTEQVDFDAGVKLLKQALAIEPDYVLAYVALGHLTSIQFEITYDPQALEKSIQYFDKAYDLNPQLPQALTGKGYAQHIRAIQGAGDVITLEDEAFNLCRRAVIMSPNSYGANQLMGVIYLIGLSLYHQALPFFERGAELEPYQAWPDFQKAHCYTLLGNVDLALHYYNKVLQRAPNFPTFLQLYFLILVDKERYGEAEEVLARLIEISPNNHFIPSFRVSLLFCQGEKYKALVLAKSGDEKLHPRVYATLGMADEVIDEIRKLKDTYFYVPYLDLVHPTWYAPLRGDPRFEAIVQEQKAIYDEKIKKYGDLKALFPNIQWQGADSRGSQKK